MAVVGRVNKQNPVNPIYHRPLTQTKNHPFRGVNNEEITLDLLANHSN